MFLKERKFFWKKRFGRRNFRIKFKISPYSFFQTNSKTVAKLYGKVLDYLDEIEGENIHNSVVFDLFSGTGTIGQIVSKRQNKFMELSLWKKLLKKQMKIQN